MKEIANYLKIHPEIKIVYFNSKGGWVFSKNLQFPDEKNRDEIISLGEEQEIAESIAEEKATEEKLEKIKSKRSKSQSE